MKSLTTYLSAFFIISLALSSCNPVNDLGLTCEDQQVMMSTALNGKYFLEAYSELQQYGRSDGKIYILDTLARKDKCIVEMKHSTELKFLDSFNFDRTFLEEGKDPRFTVSMPQFKKNGDTIHLELYLYKFYSRLEYNFVKQNKVWKLVSENEVMQKSSQ